MSFKRTCFYWSCLKLQTFLLRLPNPDDVMFFKFLMTSPRVHIHVRAFFPQRSIFVSYSRRCRQKTKKNLKHNQNKKNNGKENRKEEEKKLPMIPSARHTVVDNRDGKRFNQTKGSGYEFFFTSGHALEQVDPDVPPVLCRHLTSLRRFASLKINYMSSGF